MSSQVAEAAGSKLRAWRENPAQFAHECFGFNPDPWQLDVLQAFPHNQRMAMKACKGPGKTGLLSILIWNFLATRPHPKVACTSITADNLADGLWTELAKWRNNSPFIKQAFEWTKTRIFARDHPETWWASARTWSKGADSNQQADTLAGLHADYLLFVLDEVGGIPDAVMAAAEAGLSTGIETKIVMAGNPTHLEGPLYRASTNERHLWHLTEITGDPDDPKRSPRISVQWAREQIEKYGRDNPWVLVNVFGRFPPSSLNALLGPDEVGEAMRRHLREDEYSFAAKLLGVDVARFGDDRNVVFPRQGMAAFRPKILRNVRTNELADVVALASQTWGAHGIFVDGTGGYGAGVVDSLLLKGHAPIEVSFAGKALNPRYFNKRAEMYFEAAEWVKRGGALPNIPELQRELCAITYTFQGDKLRVEEKEHIKERLGYSPDLADGFVLTFAAPIAPPPPGPHGLIRTNRAATEYDPFAESAHAATEYNPFA